MDTSGHSRHYRAVICSRGKKPRKNASGRSENERNETLRNLEDMAVKEKSGDNKQLDAEETACPFSPPTLTPQNKRIGVKYSAARTRENDTAPGNSSGCIKDMEANESGQSTPEGQSSCDTPPLLSPHIPAQGSQ